MPNTLADFPPERFGIAAHCACGHSGWVDTTRLPPSLPIDTLHARLRCQVCGSQEINIGIVWTAASGYQHGG